MVEKVSDIITNDPVHGHLCAFDAAAVCVVQRPQFDYRVHDVQYSGLFDPVSRFFHQSLQTKAEVEMGERKKKENKLRTCAFEFRETNRMMRSSDQIDFPS